MSPNSDIKHVSSLFDAILHQNIFEITIKSSIFSGLLNSSSECFVTELSRLPGEPVVSTLQAWLTTAHPRPGAAGIPQDSISVFSFSNSHRLLHANSNHTISGLE